MNPPLPRTCKIKSFIPFCDEPCWTWRGHISVCLQCHVKTYTRYSWLKGRFSMSGPDNDMWKVISSYSARLSPQGVTYVHTRILSVYIKDIQVHFSSQTVLWSTGNQQLLSYQGSAQKCRFENYVGCWKNIPRLPNSNMILHSSTLSLCFYCTCFKMDKNLLVRQINGSFFSLPSGIKDSGHKVLKILIWCVLQHWPVVEKLRRNCCIGQVSGKSRSVYLIYPQQLCGAAVCY